MNPSTSFPANPISHYWSLIWVAFLSIGFMLFQMNSGNFNCNDFAVYYRTAARLLEAKTLYRYVEDGHYIFKYSPTSAVYFIWTTFLSFENAKIVYWLFQTFLVVLGFNLLTKLVAEDWLKDKRYSSINLTTWITSLIVAIHFLRELDLGQVNHLLMVTYISAIYQYSKGNFWTTGLLLAISLYLKPFGLIFIPYFILQKDLKTISITFLFTFLLFWPPFLFYADFDATFAQYGLWIAELKSELLLKQDLFAGNNYTLASILVRLTPLGFLIKAFPGLEGFYKLSVLLLVGIWVLWFCTKNNAGTKGQSIDMLVLCSLIPLLSYTSENAFGIGQPLAFILLIHFRAWDRIAQISLGFVLFCLIMNTTELRIIDNLGEYYGNKFIYLSLLPLSIIAMLSYISILRFRHIV